METIVPNVDVNLTYEKKLGISNEEKLRLLETLKPRERDTYLFLLGCYTIKETAKQLGMSYSTVNTY